MNETGSPPAGSTPPPVKTATDELPPPAGGGRDLLVAEALGYVGGALAITGGVISFRMLWPHPGTGTQLGVSAAVAAILAAAGFLVSSSQPAMKRLRAGLWTLSVLATALFTGVLAFQVFGFGNLATWTLAGAVATCYGLVLLLRAPSPVLELVTFGSVIVAGTTGIALAAHTSGLWAQGLAVCALSVLWAAAVERGYLRPRKTGRFAAGAGLLAGAAMVTDLTAGQGLAVAIAAAALLTGVATRRVWLIVTGGAGMVFMVPGLLGTYLPRSAAAPLAVCVVGVVLVTGSLWIVRHRAHLR